MEDALGKETMKNLCVACGTLPPLGWQAMGEKDGYTLFKCNSCGTISVLPVPSLPTELYDKNYFCAGHGGSGYVNYDLDKEAMKSELVSALESIEKIKIEKGKLFDVGAATGFFINLAHERGWHVSGIEISPYAAEIARSKGLNVVTGTLASLSGTVAKYNKYDVVTMWDVIEHLPGPDSDLVIVNSILNDNGILLIVTPDASSLYAKLRGIAWHLLTPPEHINCFSRFGITKILERKGYEIMEIKAPKKKFPLAYSLHVISRVTGLTVLDKLSRKLSGTWFGNLLMPLDVRDNMLVIARKK